MGNLGFPDTSVPVEPYDRTTDTNLAIDINGKIGVSSCALPTGAATESTLSTLNTKVPSQGQAIMAASTPVVIASNQTDVPENITKISGAAPSATNPLPVRQTDGTSFYDGRQIRALTNADVVKAQLQDNSGTGVTVGQKVMTSSLPVVISSDQSAIPVSTGLPFFLPYTFGYAVGINQPSAGTDNPLIFLKNPSGSGKTIYLSFVSYGVAVANVLGTIRIYYNPTTTANGTSQTINSFGGGTTVMNLYTVPTVTSNGTLYSSYVTGQNTNSILIQINYEISIAANNTVLITGNPGSNNRQAEISMRWIEI